MHQLHSSFLWFQYRSAPRCGDLKLLLPKNLNPALQGDVEETSPVCPGLKSPILILWETFFRLLLKSVRIRPSLLKTSKCFSLGGVIELGSNAPGSAATKSEEAALKLKYEELRSSMTPRKKLKGLVAATITPMTPDGKINLPVISQYVDYLVNEQDVKNVFVNGTTGEGLSLSIQERKQLAEEWMCRGKDKLDHVIIHVGALNLPECQELARHAAAIGAGGIAVIAPFFFKPTHKDELVAFLQKVASEAPEVPFYYYHIPPLTGVKIRVEELLDGIKAQIPTFQGVKFSDTDLLDLAQCINKNKTGEFEFLYGVDEQLLGALAVGVNGAVGSTYNYLGRQTNLMLQAFAKPDFALAQQYQLLTGEFLSFVIKLGFGVAQTKAVMTFVSGIPMGPPRLPLVDASSEFIVKAKAKLDSIVWPNGD